jgi:hypothetical protein
MPSLMKIRSVGAKLFLVDGERERETDRQTDMIKLIVAFRNFAKETKKHYVEFIAELQLGLLFKQRKF